MRPHGINQKRSEAHLGRGGALTPDRAPSRVTAPAKQLLRRQPVSPRNRRHVVAALVTLGENPRLLLRRPRPTAARSREHLESTNRLFALRFVQKLCVRHVSNPQQNQATSDNRSSALAVEGAVKTPLTLDRLPLRKNRPAVSSRSFPQQAFQSRPPSRRKAYVNPAPPGFRLDANQPRSRVPIP